MFVKKAWYVGAWSADLSTKPMARHICGEPIVLFRDLKGRAAGLKDACCHRAAPLSAGRVVADGLECGYHGLVFNAEGACVHIPGQEQIPSTAKVRSYPVVEKDDLVWIWLGPAEEADPSKILDYPFHADRAKWPYRHQTLHVASDYMFLVDNLMDLTHLGYVHASNVGGNPTIHTNAEMKIEPTPRGLTISRRMLNSPPPPTYANAVPFKGNVDRWQEFEFIAPGTVIQWTGAVEAQTGNFAGGNRDGGFALRIFHGVTPETETTCWYFWSAANGYRQNDPSATDELYKEVEAALIEDKEIVELQQARFSEVGEAELITIRSDHARIIMRRTMNRLLAAEGARH